MEQLTFDYPAANRRVTKKAHVGIVGSGDMEVLMQPSDTGAGDWAGGGDSAGDWGGDSGATGGDWGGGGDGGAGGDW